MPTSVDVESIERPDPSLMKYYAIQSLFLGPLFFLVLIPRYFRYHTLRYRFDREGVSMQWGILFRREISLNYSRIQDIHLSSNLIERWLGLARIEVQTASGSSSAEMTIEGIVEFAAVRDFLYSNMRGARDHGRDGASDPAPGGEEDLAGVLREVAAELRALRETIGTKG